MKKYISKIIPIVILGILVVAGYGIVTVFQSLDSTSLTDSLNNLPDIITIILLALVLLLGIGWYLDHHALTRHLAHTDSETHQSVKQTWRNQYLQLLSAQVFGTILTVGLVSMVVLIFGQYRDIENAKADLIMQMSSSDNAFALEATRIARQKGWLEDGTLQGAILRASNLQGAQLSDAVLSDAILSYANLRGVSLWSSQLDNASLQFTNLAEINAQHANLSGANLQNAIISQADLLGAILRDADLSHADLSTTILAATDFTGANMENAVIVRANLDGANLTGVNLLSADLTGAYFNNTVLPDQSVGTDDTDMSRFTDPQHPDYDDTLLAINRIRTERGFAPIQP